MCGWLAAGVVVFVGTRPSGSPSENMNGLVLLALPAVLGVAVGCTALAALPRGHVRGGRSYRVVWIIVGLLALIAFCGGTPLLGMGTGLP